METKIFGNVKNPSVLIIGVFHGDEPQGNYLIRKYLEINPNTNLLMLPCLNESGFKAGTRVNKNKVDLNRNFPTQNWVLGTRNEFYGGDFPGSEPETRFLISTIEKYLPKVIITLHAPYKVVNFDGGKSGEGLELAKKISDIIKYPVEEDIGYSTPGSFGTWAGVEKDIPTITLELDDKIDIKELEYPVFKIFKMFENY